MLPPARRSCWSALSYGAHLHPRLSYVPCRLASQQAPRNNPKPQSSLQPRNPPPPPTRIDRLNPPPTVYPPPLNVPFWDASKPHYKNYYELGKAYLKFYKTGFYQIKDNVNLVRFHIALPTLGRKRDTVAALKAGKVSRSEHRVHQSAQSDLSKLPLFGLLFCITGEFTPLFVPFLSAIVPRTLWLPIQQEKAQRKARERVERFSPKADDDAVPYVAGKDCYESHLTAQEVGASQVRKARIAAGVAINAWPRFWDPLVSNVLPISLLASRLKRKADDLRLDDMAIERDGGVKRLNEAEARRAAELRGLHTAVKEEEWKDILQKCIKVNRKDWAEDMRGAVQDPQGAACSKGQGS